MAQENIPLVARQEEQEKQWKNVNKWIKPYLDHLRNHFRYEPFTDGYYCETESSDSVKNITLEPSKVFKDFHLLGCIIQKPVDKM